MGVGLTYPQTPSIEMLYNFLERLSRYFFNKRLTTKEKRINTKKSGRGVPSSQLIG